MPATSYLLGMQSVPNLYSLQYHTIPPLSVTHMHGSSELIPNPQPHKLQYLTFTETDFSSYLEPCWYQDSDVVTEVLLLMEVGVRTGNPCRNVIPSQYRHHINSNSLKALKLLFVIIQIIGLISQVGSHIFLTFTIPFHSLTHTSQCLTSK